MASTVLPASPSERTTPAPWLARLHRASILLAPALVYLVIRQVSLIVLAWMSAANGISIRSALTSWDGAWFLGLAKGGYGGIPAQLVDAFGVRSAETPLAFFPGYPMLVAGVARMASIGIVSAAFTVTISAGVIAAYGLVRLTELVPHGSRKAGLILVALFAASPMSIVLSMTYSEALFCALAVWCLIYLLRRQWLLAGVCSAAAGLVRPSAAALIATVVLAGLVATLRDLKSWRLGGAHGGWRPWRGQDSWRPWAAMAIAPTGLVGYLVFVAIRTGRWDGWFALQRRGWDSRFDGGLATLRFTRQALTTAPSVLEVTTVWLMAGSLVLLLICVLDWRRSPAWPLLVYAAIVLAMDLGSNGLMNSKARLLLPAFVLLLPLAIGLTRRRTVLALCTLTAAVIFGAWFGSYAITVWPYAI